MFHSSKQRGFTLIELLVVIAIIGILAAVVLASLNDARNSGNNASAQQSLNNLRSQAEIFYNANGFQYLNGTANICAANNTNTGLLGAVERNTPANAVNATTPAVVNGALQTATTVNCNVTATAWAASAPLFGTPQVYFCVDSRGFAGTRTTALGAGATVCPAT